MVEFGNKVHAFYIAGSTLDFNHNESKITRVARIKEYDNYLFAIGAEKIEDNFFPIDHEGRLDTFGKFEIIKNIEKVIQKVKPDILLIQGPSFHQDHQIVYESCIAATRPTALHYPSQILVMENPTYVHKLYPQLELPINYFFKLTRNQVEKKLNIIRNCFPSQIRSDDNYLSLKGIETWARYRGIEARCEFAEGFHQYVRVE
jgi:LmbE family N-acetylglucosaminyl deacetylase